MFKNIQEKIYTPGKFYEVFLSSDNGKKAFDNAYKQFILPDNLDLFVNYIMNSMQDWLFEQLTDDEINSADTLFQSMEGDLKSIVLELLVDFKILTPLSLWL